MNKRLTNSERLELAELKLEKKRRKAKTCFFTFLKLLSPVEFEWNWHHVYTCGILQRWITTDEFPRIMIFMPPQHQKSTMLTEFLPAWAFGQNKDYQAILTMYNSTQAKKQSRKIKRIIRSQEYKKIFPDVKINERGANSDAVNTAEEFEIIDSRGFLKAVGVDGGIAGNPAKLAFMDDVIKNVKEANSETYRNSVYDWYTDELEARLHNDSKVAFTITRRHEDDLAGRLLKRDGKIEDGGKWKVIKLPAIKQDNSNPDDPRKIGEALFPGLHSLERLLEIEEKKPRTFAGLYQQEPKVKGGDMIKGKWFIKKKPSQLPFNMDEVTWNGWIDGAWGKKKSDRTATGYEYFDKQREKLYIRFVGGFRKRISEAIKYVENESSVHGWTNSSMFNIEMKSSGWAFYDFMRNDGFLATEIDNDYVALGKETRVENSEPFIRGGKVVLIDEGNWIDSFIDECEAFPNGANDDKVDILCYMIHKYFIGDVNPYIYT